MQKVINKMFQECRGLTQTQLKVRCLAAAAVVVVFFCFDFMVGAQRGFPESQVPAMSRSQAGDHQTGQTSRELKVCLPF